jgi:hypothetical protein
LCWLCNFWKQISGSSKLHWGGGGGGLLIL